MHTYYLSAGASRRPNIMDNINDIIVYASIANVILVDIHTLKKNVIIRDIKNEITFLQTTSQYIVLCDILGHVEIYAIENGIEYRLYKSAGINKQLYAVCLARNDEHFIGIGIEEIYFIKDLCISKTVKTTHLLSSVCGFEMDHEQYYVFGFNNGSIEIYNESLDFIITSKIQSNTITCIKHKVIENETFIISSSLDFTVKICKIICIDKVVKIIEVDVLYGHVDRVLGCNWTHNGFVISCSADNNVIIWKKDSNKWSLHNKLGGLYEKAQTFYSCLEVNDNIYAQSISGGIYRYKHDTLGITKFVSGHVDEISSIDVSGDMILTSSLDYTSRIFSIRLCEEVGRPQIHGYRINCARFLKEMPLRIISGADETVMRILRSTQIFDENYKRIMNNNFGCIIDSEYIRYIEKDNKSSNYPRIARLAELSLTNEVFDHHYNEILEEGNNERNLSMHFLFAETNKLYGHFFEISDIAVSNKFIISANTATNIKFSGIFVWNYQFEKIDYIPVHSLGIQRLKFSRDGNYIIACSRDTTLSFYKLVEGRFKHFNTFTTHKRIVWDCDISFDNSLAVSCSRDKNLFVYDLNSLEVKYNLGFDHEPTSLCFHGTKNIFVVGFLDGTVKVYEIQTGLVLIMSKRVHSSKINCINYISENKICTGGEDGMLVVLDIK